MNAKGIVHAIGRGLALAAVLATLGSLAACRRPSAMVSGVSMTQIAPGPVASTFGAVLTADGSGLRVAYADLRSRTLVLADVELTGRRGGEPIVMDRIAESAEWDEDLGSLVYTMIAGVEYLAYLDRGADGGATLKVLYRSPEDERWNVDLVESAGRPLGFLDSEGDVRLLLEAEDGVDAAGVSRRVRGERRSMVAGVTPRGRVSVVRRDEGDAAALFDSATGRMVLVGWTGSRAWSIELTSPSRGVFGPVYHVRLDPTGNLSLFYYDPTTQELLDLRDLEGDSTLIGVTRARDVAAVEARTDASVTSYVWADMSLEAGGRLSPALSMIRTSGGPTGSMQRIGTSAVPYRSLGLFTTPEEILVLALGDKVTLHRLGLAAR